MYFLSFRITVLMTKLQVKPFLNIMIIGNSRIQSRFIVCIDFPIFQYHFIDIWENDIGKYSLEF